MRGIIFCLLVLMSAASSVSRAVRLDRTLFRKPPYLLLTGEAMTMELHWQVFSTCDCTLQWGPDTLYALETIETYEYGDDHQHRYAFHDLIPECHYYYRVSIDDWVHTGSFRAPPTDDAPDLKFLAYGDTRAFPENHDWVAAAMNAVYANDPAYQTLTLSIGDIVESGGREELWDSEFFSSAHPNILARNAQLPFQSCIGNHETFIGGGQGYNVDVPTFKKYFPYPFVEQTYWSFDYGCAHFVILDQYPPGWTPDPGMSTLMDTQVAWIAADLASSTKPWKFVVLHEPGYSAGHYSNSIDVQVRLQPLCEMYGVAIVFAGHNHYYARAVVNGVTHLTIAGGGAELYYPNPNYPYIVTTTRDYHFVKLDIQGSHLTCEALTPGGEIIDQFTLSEPASTRNASFQPPSVRLVALPNPMRAATTLCYSLAHPAEITIDIYDLMGRLVAPLYSGSAAAGPEFVIWRGCDAEGRPVPRGTYLCRLTSAPGTATTRLQIVR